MFTYNIQLAGYNYNQYDEKGNVNYDEFINALLQFPWLEQVQQYDDLRNGCSATISVTNTTNNESLWVSVKGTPNEYNYLIGYVYRKKIRSFWGLGKEKLKMWVDIYELERIDNTTLQYYKYFFNTNTDDLIKNLRLEAKFASMEKFQQ